MARVIARHDEEDSGARIVFSALTALLPFTLIARVIASALGSGALMGSWAEQQRREADEIALALLDHALTFAGFSLPHLHLTHLSFAIHT